MQKIGTQVRITVTELQIERIDKIAKRLGIPKAKVYRNMLDVGLDFYDDFESIGVVKLLEFSKKAKELSKEIIQKKQLKLF